MLKYEILYLFTYLFQIGRHESQFIHMIVEEISGEVLHQTCLDVATYPVGLKSCIPEVDKFLDVGGEGVRMVGIWGTGGICKTTIAKAVYNSIASNFDGSCFLANVKRKFNVMWRRSPIARDSSS